MLDRGQNWELFGYDVRHLGRYWVAAWRDLLWAHDSPVRQRLDEVVSLASPEGETCYQAGQPCPATSTPECRAILLPEQLVLAKSLRVPLAAEAELENIVSLEVRASSPFTAEDTRWGWGVVARDDAQLQLVVVIVSASATMSYLGRDYDIHDIYSREVWADGGGTMVVLRGFGESRREQRYRRRLLHCVAMLGLVAVLVLVIAGLAAAFKGAQLQQLEALSATTSRDAAEASRLKSLLASANETIGAANDVVARYPSPHVELARLSALLADDVSITSFAMSGPQVRIRGRATDAAAVMEELTEVPAFLEVQATRAIVKLGDTGQEQFDFDIRVAGGEQP